MNVFLKDLNLGTWDNPASGTTKDSNSIYIYGEKGVSISHAADQYCLISSWFIKRTEKQYLRFGSETELRWLGNMRGYSKYSVLALGEKEAYSLLR